MNHKNERIRKLWDRGIRDPEQIARKLGLADAIRVKEGLASLAKAQLIDRSLIGDAICPKH